MVMRDDTCDSEICILIIYTYDLALLSLWLWSPWRNTINPYVTLLWHWSFWTRSTYSRQVFLSCMEFPTSLVSPLWWGQFNLTKPTFLVGGMWMYVYYMTLKNLMYWMIYPTIHVYMALHCLCIPKWVVNKVAKLVINLFLYHTNIVMSYHFLRN